MNYVVLEIRLHVRAMHSIISSLICGKKPLPRFKPAFHILSIITPSESTAGHEAANAKYMLENLLPKRSMTSSDLLKCRFYFPQKKKIKNPAGFFPDKLSMSICLFFFENTSTCIQENESIVLETYILDNKQKSKHLGFTL